MYLVFQSFTYNTSAFRKDILSLGYLDISDAKNIKGVTCH